MSDNPFDLISTDDTFSDSDWFHLCRQTQIPYVVVRSGETSADVLWDYVTLPPCCDARLHRDFAALERDARAIFDRFALPESHLRIKPTLICFDRLPFDRAKRAAAELYGLIANYLPDTRGPLTPTAPQESSRQATPEALFRPEHQGQQRRGFWLEH